MEFRILPVTGFQQNCTLLWCARTRRAAIVDPGGEPDRIEALLNRLELEPERILLTHGHLDHVGASAELARRLAIPVEGPHPDDAFLFQSLPEQCRMFGFPPITVFEPDRWLQPGERISVGDESLEVIHCPGHTPGHIVFYQAESQLAQVGDVLFRGSIGRTDFPRGNHRRLLDSIRQRLFPLGDAVRFIPGHGPMSTFGEERRSNPFVGD
ncbi:MBL fold metallo-hydrolase [Allochromatium tepidum]|uniref:Zn-dependent hydrolase glyoxalase II family protein n=1 Tax=Allochromatium tepidum TaxID=553982 RepID=A0ABM7QNJ6_9GAMM|nr:MBL fold metallo-hydrolase [Allochromatium tepidum]BCU07416.1 Zn-dependent hydrolase glyoxalase II family protein [Allochromatium tepidum]